MPKAGGKKKLKAKKKASCQTTGAVTDTCEFQVKEVNSQKEEGKEESKQKAVRPEVTARIPIA